MSGCKGVVRFFAVVGFFFSTCLSSTPLLNVSPTFHSLKHLTQAQLLDLSGKTFESADSSGFVDPAEALDAMMNMGTYGRDGDEKSNEEPASRTKWNDEQHLMKRRWGDNSMAVWGKRGNTSKEDEIKGWDGNTNLQQSSYHSVDKDKRRWGDNSMSAWGKRYKEDEQKRRWNDNSMRVWGKRALEGKQEVNDGLTEKENESIMDDLKKVREKEKIKEDSDEKFKLAKEKKKNEERRMIIKRSVLDDTEYSNDLMSDVVKRVWPGRWSSNLPSGGNQYGGPKRNWETNTMKVWGKRGLVSKEVPRVWRDRNFDSADENVKHKRSWASDNTIRIWGKKRNSIESEDDDDHVGSNYGRR